MARWQSMAALILSMLGATQAVAQDVTLNPYVAPFGSEDGLALNRPITMRHRQLSAQLTFDYADDSLVVEVRRGDSGSERAALVERSLIAHARFAFGLFDRLVLMAGLDGALAMSGESFSYPGSATTLRMADGPGLADARIGARYHAYGDLHGLFALALQAQLTFPLAEAANDEQRLTGERTVSGRTELLLELRPGPVRVTANLGAVIRRNGKIVDTTVGDQLTFGLGVASRELGSEVPIELLGELYGATNISAPFGRSTTPLELLFGARATFLERFRVALAGGPGLTRGVGSPDFRLLLALSFRARHLLDSDDDGINNRRDLCPDAREDRDGYLDADGCADLDNDGDHVPDEQDRCPQEAEDLDRVEDYDGCVDPDNDGDGVLDGEDECPLEPEDRDGFEDENGCPDRG